VSGQGGELFNQGNDVGRQYRSAIFYADDMQREVAELYMDQIERAGVFDAPLATELVPLEAFCVAEDYHHDYAARNPDQPYIGVGLAVGDGVDVSSAVFDAVDVEITFCVVVSIELAVCVDVGFDGAVTVAVAVTRH
jgi:hypothetical protein